jgi:hypothetical protein
MHNSMYLTRVPQKPTIILLAISSSEFVKNKCNLEDHKNVKNELYKL